MTELNSFSNRNFAGDARIKQAACLIRKAGGSTEGSENTIHPANTQSKTLDHSAAVIALTSA